MNHTYRLVWNHLTQAWVAVAEHIKSHGKRSGSVLVAAAALLSAPAFALDATALPTGGKINAGSASIASTGTQMTVTQNSQRLVADWSSYNIGQNASVTYVQPGSSAIALNRIAATAPSEILGRLKANGQVWLLNSAGIIFGQTAQVDVGGLVASSLSLSNEDFLAGKFRFAQNGLAGTVLNQGSLKGKVVALIGPAVQNSGSIQATNGAAVLAAGDKVSLDFTGDGLIGITVDKGALNALAENSGSIQADGGLVQLSAKSADALTQSAVNNSGVIQARTLASKDGKIMLLADMQSGTVHVGGVLDASAPTAGKGGFIETSAAHVKVADGAKVTTLAASGKSGTWLIDPVDFTIAASGGDMTGATLSANLGGGPVTIQSTTGAAGTAGDVNVNDVVTWSANTLTLNAQNNININTAMMGSGTAGLALEYGQGAVAAGNTATYKVNAPVNLAATGSFSTKLGNDAVATTWTILTSLGAAGSVTATDLQGMNGNKNGNYVLGANIDATPTGLGAWAAAGGFTPVGTSGPGRFAGSFDGLGHTISGLYINLPAIAYVGLFGFANNATLRNVGLTAVNITVTGQDYVGALAGYPSGGTITYSYATGSVSGRHYVGGLVGNSGTAKIDASFSSATVTGTGNYIGGLVGNSGGEITASYATGAVSGSGVEGVGGLVGFIDGSAGFPARIADSYATGAVSGVAKVGGLVGILGSDGGGHHFNLSNSYATGTVSGTTSVGGLIGRITPDSMSPVYSVTGAYWNTTTSGTGAGIGNSADTAASVTGKTTAQLAAALPAGFSATVWGNGGNQTTPYLLSHAAFNTAGPVYLGSDTSPTPTAYGAIINLNQLQAMNNNLAGKYVLGANIDASGTSTWNANVGFTAVGTSAAKFTGSFDGLGHTVTGLTINSPGWNNGTNDYRGLFGYAGVGSTLRNVGLLNSSISGANVIGTLAGRSDGAISNVYANGGSVTASVHGAGGLLGQMGGGGSIGNSYANVSVTGTDYACCGGGVSSTSIGGLVGKTLGGSISNSYATGSVNGGTYVGGLVGQNYANIDTSYASGTVTARISGGGLIGNQMAGTITNSYWDWASTGQATSASGTRIGTSNTDTTSKLAQASFTGFDFTVTPVWRIYEGHTTPLLKSFLTPLTVTANAAAKTYDGAAYSGGNGVAYSTPPNANLLGAASYGGTSQGAKNVGSYVITLGGLYSNQRGYDIAMVNGGLSITRANLAVSGLGAANKTYDASTAATLTGAASVTALAGDSVTLGGTAVGTFATKGVGTAKAVTVTGNTLAGADADNYNIVQQTGLTADITKKDISVSGLTASNKTYDARTVATLGGTASVTALSGDNLSVGGTAAGAFADKNVGTAKAVTVTGNTLGGTDAGNYNIVQQTGLTADIARANLAVTGLTAANKTYDATTTATLTGTAAVTALGSDNVSVSGTAVGAFATKGVGTGKAVTVTGNTLSGTDAGNYNIVQQTSLTADITKKDISVTGLTASNKTYDAGTVATLGGAASVTALSGDNLSVGGTATGAFANKNVGAAKAVTVTGNTLGGTDAGNYNIVQQTGLTADITKKDISVSGLTASNKTYDAGTVATLGGAASVTALSGDNLSVGGTATGAFANKNAGTAKAVTVTGNTLGGTDAGNYNLVQQTGLTADITKKDISVSGLTASNKTYDAGTVATLGGTASVTALSGDNLSVGGTATGAFANKNAGTAKAVTVTGNTLGGTDAGNYNLVQQTGLTADITKKDISVSGLTASNKTYDAGTVATLGGAASVTALSGDNLSVGGTATGTFANKNAGTAKAVTVTGNTLSGLDAGNYNIVQQTGLTADITRANLAVTGLAAASKTYDATTSATLTGTAAVTALGSDSVSVSGTAVGTFTDKNAGTGKAITVTGLSLSGADAGNYNVGQQIGIAADIARANLAVTGLAASNKTYDASTAATLTGTATVATLGTDSVSVGGTAVGAFTDKNVGTSKAIAVTGNTLNGTDAGNYNLIQQSGLTADIARANITVSGLAAANKTYDASITATLMGTATVAALGSDVLTLAGTASAAFADKQAGTGKRVLVSGLTLTGNDAGNYQLVQSAGIVADITPQHLIVTARDDNKAYTGSAYSGGNGVSYNGLVSGETSVDLAGTLIYGGSSQGATMVGDYVIQPSGLLSPNYAIGYANGSLKITRPEALDATVSSLNQQQRGTGLQTGKPIDATVACIGASAGDNTAAGACSPEEASGGDALKTKDLISNNTSTDGHLPSGTKGNL
ncbi:MAG: YDG domain-containing protein [Rhodoferax sp.]|uniref:YDG domain-containing protein n=1 Tax=Rhodoferax sp. TaxID=50421 RepID=UPI0026120EDE|nr:YDG domain-containing protein [Rhodoferax sp.]MDD5332742.1 YDG domain-containing protein [Rhodoferax sp.]